MTRTKSFRAADRRALDWRTGAVAGIVGGIAYTVFVESVNVVANGPGAFFHPFRQIGAVVLGPRALQDGYDLSTAMAAGAAVHLAIAAAFGIMLARVAARLAAPHASGLIALGSVAGLALYVVDVLVVFPAAFPWFLGNDRLTQSLGHALFGAVTGAWLAPRRSA